MMPNQAPEGMRSQPPEPVTLTTRDGINLRVRPVIASDEPILASLFDRMTMADLRYRFLSSMRHVDHARLDAMIDVDYDRTITFIAFDETRDAVATSMFVGDDDRVEGEVAISVRSDVKGRGIGWRMLQHAIAYAGSAGFKRVRSVESRSNVETVGLEHDAGFILHSCSDDPTQVVATIGVGSVEAAHSKH